MSHEDYEKVLGRHISAATLNSIQDKLDALKKKVTQFMRLYVNINYAN